MGLHREGIPTIIISFLLLAALAAVIFLWLPGPSWLAPSLAVLAFVFWLAIISFFRYPKFDVEKNDSQVLSPADGTVVVVEKVRMNEHLDDERIQVSIFMSPANTHMNRYPVSGEIVYKNHAPGRHLVAWLPKSSSDNEHTTVIIKHGNRHIAIRQIAGAVARRIVCYARVGEKVEQGEQLGFIKFGSRVDVFLPVDAVVQVELNDPVRAGKTILALLPES